MLKLFQYISFFCSDSTHFHNCNPIWGNRIERPKSRKKSFSNQHMGDSKHVNIRYLIFPFSSNGLGKCKSRELEGPLGRGLEGPVVQHHRPPVPVLSFPRRHLLVEPLPHDRPCHERHRHRHRRRRRRPPIRHRRRRPHVYAAFLVVAAAVR